MLRRNLAVAAGSMSKTLSLRTPHRARKAKAWNSDWAPRPMSAITCASGRARSRATSADVAAVRSAVVMFISAIRIG